jgi:aminobenzoyl-glutamate utilization protein A
VRADDQASVDELTAQFTALASALGGAFGVESHIERTGYSTNPRCDAEIMAEVSRSIGQLDSVTEREPVPLGASDDAALMIDRVQSQGGQGTYVAVGGVKPGPHHHPSFDVDESTIGPTIEILVRTVLALAKTQSLT